MTASVITPDSRSSTQLEQRWHLHDPDVALVQAISDRTGLPHLLAKVLVNHGIETLEDADIFLNPELEQLPSPQSEFSDLSASVTLLKQAIEENSAIAICGDYDADGMTSTALLLRALRGLGATIDYAIPSRMSEGYGINERIVRDFAADGVKLILTVDNGIAAYEPVALARELGLAIIITDHHDLPPQLPPANAILNPKLLTPDSPYRGLAGVGVAYVLAACLAQELGHVKQVTPLLELFTLGTIADLAPLIGVNRRWVKRGLKRLPQSQYAGVQALIQISGSDSQKDTLKPDAIGFRLGPRINAVGRIADPQTVIDLLTTDDWDLALDRATACEQTNQKRQQLCAQIEQEAIGLIRKSADQPGLNPQRDRILALVKAGWHHGVIGIVASRLVERYGVPVFIATYENEAQTEIRGSARGNPEFDVFAALEHCKDSLGKFGGHYAAGGFSLAAQNWGNLQTQLIEFAHQCLVPENLKPLITIDSEANFSDLNWPLFHGIDQLHPCGIGNPEPIFWSRHVQVTEQSVIGKQKNHLRLILRQPEIAPEIQFKAMAWRWGEYAPLPDRIDIAYRLRDNYWNGETTLELELIGYRPTLESPDPIPEPLIKDIAWICPEPPLSEARHKNPKWLELNQPLEVLLQTLSGSALLYGHQYPVLDSQSLTVKLEFDRPTQTAETLILWTLPPSWQHLKWLLALTQPQQVYIRPDHPPMLDADQLRSQLKAHLSLAAGEPLNLLALGQDWWVSPSAIVAALREMNCPCDGFPETLGLAQEFQRLQAWYQYPPHVIGNFG